MVRTLFITKEKPYPPAGGVELRNWQNINIMMQYGSVGVFSICQWSASSQVPAGIDFWYPYTLAKSVSSWENWKRRAWLLRPNAHPDVDRLYQQAAAKKLEKVLAEFQPDLTIVEEIWLYRYLKIIKRQKCRIIFDEHNIEADLFEQKHGALKMRLPRLKSIELDFIRKADQTWVCSEEDVALVKTLYGRQFQPQAIPNGIDVASYDCVRLEQCNPPEGFGEKQHNLIYMGTFSYPPNKVAAKLLIEEIYPRLRKSNPNCRLLLVGRSPTKSMLQAAELEPGIIVTGSVPDIRPYLAAASVMVVPLQQGGGTRLKLLEAFASGCPAVSTTKGAEGLNVTDGEHLLIRDEIEAITEAVEQLWSKNALVEKLTAAAYELVKAEYSWEAVSKRVDQALQQLL
ncbi:glycosyl transferase family 1 [Hydrococcus rivularis NIES-593]|uniref:Glycosyl transferase family 1 n=1 Tax=Hydrococcus rivularis NIES-593 TaxID=1921803 RepID=A0A1U7H7W3_9CYAN|nr:glycosyltransferase family 4 protein [Hydrococcus rivularis]OKH18673.1 glycosyl transferase family 1 [Hydrococcus rivularis NIES-593]